jgi:hypothetical protein
MDGEIPLVCGEKFSFFAHSIVSILTIIFGIDSKGSWWNDDQNCFLITQLFLLASGTCSCGFALFI